MTLDLLDDGTPIPHDAEGRRHLAYSIAAALYKHAAWPLPLRYRRVMRQAAGLLERLAADL